MSPRRSPLHGEHEAAGARFTEFAGWTMPLAFPAGTIAEHLACRRSAAVFDVSHLATLTVRGRTAVDHVASTLSNDLSRVDVGGTQYTLLLNDAGGVVDDLVVWRLADDELHVLANAANVHHVHAAVGGVDITAHRALIAVQGPRAFEVLATWSPDAVVARHRVHRWHTPQGDVVVAGTGYTGEIGAELSIPHALAVDVWRHLVAAGAQPAGLGARDTLRLEAGLPLHGADLDPATSPFESGVGWAVALGRNFTGASAAAVARVTASRHRVGVITSGRRPPRAGATVMVGDEEVGEVTSGNWSPVLEQGMCLARVDRRVTVGSAVTVRVRDHELPGRVVPLPFVRGGSTVA